MNFQIWKKNGLCQVYDWGIARDVIEGLTMFWFWEEYMQTCNSKIQNRWKKYRWIFFVSLAVITKTNEFKKQKQKKQIGSAALKHFSVDKSI